MKGYERMDIMSLDKSIIESTRLKDIAKKVSVSLSPNIINMTPKIINITMRKSAISLAQEYEEYILMEKKYIDRLIKEVE